MYAALWRALPQRIWLKILILAAGGLALITLLMLFVFPWVDQLLSSGVTVN